MLRFGDPTVDPAGNAACQNAGDKAGQGGYAADVDQVAVGARDQACNDTDPGTEQNSPDMTAIIRTLTSEPSTGTPDRTEQGKH